LNWLNRSGAGWKKAWIPSGTTGSHREPVDVAAAVQHLETSRGAPSYAFFDVEMEARLRREEIIAQDLRRFMANPSLGTVHLHYQPKVAAASLPGGGGL
jgi:hypothetical protein